MNIRRVWRALLIVSVTAIAALLPATGQSMPAETDGSTYTWAGAAVLTVDVKPWGGGYVRSEPYLIDCPKACIRPFDQNREITLAAAVTPGHKFESWEGACAGQGNPCKLKLTGTVIEVTAVFSGQYVPPAPPAPAFSPTLDVEVTEGDCDPVCFTTTLAGAGYHPNSPIEVEFSDGSTGEATSDSSGAWTAGFDWECSESGKVEIDVTATDAEGASASTHVSGTCPEPEEEEDEEGEEEEEESSEDGSSEEAPATSE